MPTLNISLSPSLASFVDGEVTEGRYDSAADVIRAGLALLQLESEHDHAKLDALRAAVAEGIADAEAGRFSDRSAVEIAEELIARSARAA